MTLKELIRFGKQQSDNAAIAQLTVGQLTCNSLTVNHYFQIGSFVARYDALKDIKEDTIVLTLEAIKK